MFRVSQELDTVSSVEYLIKYHLNRDFLKHVDTTAIIKRLNDQKVTWVITNQTTASAMQAMSKSKIVVTINKPKLSERISSAGFKFILNYVNLSYKAININSKTTKMIIDTFSPMTLYEFRLGRCCDFNIVQYLINKFPRSIYSVNSMTPLEIEPLLTGRLVSCDHTVGNLVFPQIDPQKVNLFLTSTLLLTTQCYSRTLTTIGMNLVELTRDVREKRFNTEEEKSIINLILEWVNGCINYLQPGHDGFIDILCDLIELTWTTTLSDDTIYCIDALFSLAESKNMSKLAASLEQMHLNLLLANIEATRKKPQRHVYDYELPSTYASAWIKRAVPIANNLIKKQLHCHAGILSLLDNIRRSLATFSGRNISAQHIINLALYFEIKGNLNVKDMAQKQLIESQLDQINKIIIAKKLSTDLKTRNPELSVDIDNTQVSEVSMYQQFEPTDLADIMKNKRYVILNGHLFFEHNAAYFEAIIDDWSCKYESIIRQNQSKAKFIDVKPSDFSRWYSSDKFWTLLSAYSNATDYKDNKTLKMHFKPTSIIDHFLRVGPSKKALSLLSAMLLENLNHKNKRQLVDLAVLWAKNQSVELLTHIYSGITNNDHFSLQVKQWLELDHWLSALVLQELYNKHDKTISLPGLSTTQYNLTQLLDTNDPSLKSLHCIQRLLIDYHLSSIRELMDTKLYKFINKAIQDFITHITKHADTLEKQYASIELLLSLCPKEAKVKSLINQWCLQAFNESNDIVKKGYIAAAYAKKDHIAIFSISVNNTLPKAIKPTKLDTKYLKRIAECLSYDQQSALTINDSIHVFLFLANSNKLEVLVNKATQASEFLNQLLTQLSSEFWSSVTYTTSAKYTLFQCVSHDGLQLSINSRNKDNIIRALSCKSFEDLLAITPHVGKFDIDDCKKRPMYLLSFCQHIRKTKVTIDKTAHISADIGYMFDLLNETQQRDLAWSWLNQSVKNAPLMLIKLISDKLNSDEIPFTIAISRKPNKLLYTLHAQGIHKLVMSEQEFLTLQQPLEWLLQKPSLQRLELLFYSIVEKSNSTNYSDNSAIQSIKAYHAIKYLKTNHVLKHYTQIMTSNLRDRVLAAFQDNAGIIPLKRSEFDLWHQHLHQKFPELGTVYVFGTACLFWLKEIIRGHHHELDRSISSWDTKHSARSFPIQLTCDNPIKPRTTDRIFQERNKKGKLVFSSYCYQDSRESERLQFYDFNDKLKENIIPLGIAIRLSANKRAEIIIDHSVLSLKDHSLIITQWDEILINSPNWIQHERCKSFMQTPG